MSRGAISGTVGDVSFEMGAVITLPDPGQTSVLPDACGAVELANLTPLLSNRIGSGIVITSSSATDRSVFQNWLATNNRNYFTVMAYGPYGNTNTGAIGVVSINSITITETHPFSLSPSTINLSCGSTSPQTFTVGNSTNAPGVTNYTWNLGANNGWLYNGNPAPASISTGTTNTITLVPDCGKALSNVTATVTVGGTGYTTNASAVSIAQPTYSISGSSSICSGSSSYSITGLLCNSSVVWTAPPSNIASLSSLTGSPTTLTYNGTPGDFTLTANVTSCGVTTAVTLPIHAGSYSSSDYGLDVNGSVSGYLPWCPNKSYGFSVSNISSGATSSNFSWTIPQGWTQNYISGYLCVLNSPTSTSPPTGTINVSFTDGCGATINKSMFLAYSSSACTPANNPCFQYSPNPASSYLNVNVASGCIGSTYIRKIELVQASTGNSVYFQDYSYGNVTSTSISMYSYQSGTYYLRIYDGNTWSSYSILH